MATQKTASKGKGKQRFTTVKSVIRTLPKSSGLIDQIVAAANAGFSQREIIAAGYNKNTVYRQVRERVLA